MDVQQDYNSDNSRFSLRMLRRQRSEDRRNSLMGGPGQRKESMFQEKNVIEQEMDKMKHQLDYRSLKNKSRASPHLRLYVLEQGRNLNKLKIGAVNEAEQRPDLQIDFSPLKPKGNIEIPDIKQLFRHQKGEWLINQNKKMREHLNTNIQSLMGTLKAIGANEVPRKLPMLVKGQDQQLLSSRKLIRSLQRQKQRLTESFNSSQDLGVSSHVNLSLREISEKPKRRLKLDGIKPITVVQKSESKQMFPSTYLLYQFKNIADLKDKKERQLSSLLKNSYLNREDILNDKIRFYSKETEYYDLSPNSQMHLKNIMKRKLQHRLDLSKRQVELFVDLISEIKASHTLIEEGLVNLLAEIRDQLVDGRTIRKKDFQGLLKKHGFQREESITKHILNKLRYMMF